MLNTKRISKNEDERKWKTVTVTNYKMFDKPNKAYQTCNKTFELTLENWFKELINLEYKVVKMEIIEAPITPFKHDVLETH